MTKVAWFDTLSGIKPLSTHVDGTDISSAVTLSPPSGARKVLIQALDQNVRYTLDGTTPTASKGFQLKAGDPPIVIILEDGVTIKLIEETTTADIQYQWGL